MGTPERKIIKDEILKIIPNAKIILFGSQAMGNFDTKSDYDILISIEQSCTQREKISLSTEISKLLANKHIPVDVIIQSRSEIIAKSNMTGNIIKEAIKHGVEL